MARSMWVYVGAATLCVAALGCSSSNEPEPTDTGPRVGFDAETVAELDALGVDRYFDTYVPAKSQLESGVITYTFGSDPSGPICMWGDPFRVNVKDLGSKDLLIYLQGGGACWSDLCAANTKAPTGVPGIGFTDGQEQNPLGSFNVVYVGYCDGSVFTGDNDFSEPGGKVRRHHGLKNLSAALDLARQHFPEPERLVLAGSSAGGYGTILGTIVTRLAYPSARLYVANDAGFGLTNPDDPEMLETIKREWGFTQYIPDSCAECQSGQFSSVIGWALSHDPSLKVSLFSSYQDSVIGSAFLGMPGSEFETLLVNESELIHAAAPARFERFLVPGSAHTVMLAGYYDASVDGVVYSEWLGEMVNDSADWPDLLAPRE